MPRVITVPAVSMATLKQVKKGAGEQEEPGQNTEQVGSVLGQEKEEDDCQERADREAGGRSQPAPGTVVLRG